MGCPAGIVETGGRAAATTPRKSENGGEDRAGPGTCGRLERVGQLRCRVSFNFICYQNHQLGSRRSWRHTMCSIPYSDDVKVPNANSYLFMCFFLSF